MNNPKRIEFQGPLVEPRMPLQQKNRKIVVYLLSGFIVLAMTTWIGFLGWGMHNLLRWLLDCINVTS